MGRVQVLTHFGRGVREDVQLLTAVANKFQGRATSVSDSMHTDICVFNVYERCLKDYKSVHTFHVATVSGTVGIP